MEDSCALYREAKSLITNGCYETALKQLDRLINQTEDYEEQPENLKHYFSRVWNERGHLKYLQVDFYGAVSDFTQAISLDNTFAVPYYNRGQIHYRMGRYQEAVADLKEAVRLDPDFEDAKFNLNQALIDCKNCTEN